MAARKRGADEGGGGGGYLHGGLSGLQREERSDHKIEQISN